MNYYKQFAEMLGLELGEDFVITDSDGERRDGATYKITENGLYYRTPTSIYWFTESANTIERLLNGDVKAVPKPWKPKNDEFYYYYSQCTGITYQKRWMNTSSDYCIWKIGNCFRTREEAETKGKEIMEQLQKEYEEA